MKEKDILHETENLYLVAIGAEFEIRLNTATHSIIIGKSDNKEKAIEVMDKLERYPAQLKSCVFKN